MKKWWTDCQLFIRWQIALYLRDREGWCWTELVLWVLCLKNHPFWEILELYGTQGQCERRGELSYCGKCREEK